MGQTGVISKTQITLKNKIKSITLQKLPKEVRIFGKRKFTIMPMSCYTLKCDKCTTKQNVVYEKIEKNIAEKK